MPSRTAGIVAVGHAVLIRYAADPISSSSENIMKPISFKEYGVTVAFAGLTVPISQIVAGYQLKDGIWFFSLSFVVGIAAIFYSKKG